MSCDNSVRMTMLPEVTTGATAAVLAEKITSRRAKVGVVGLGYVGLPLAVEFARAGFEVTGIDLIQKKTDLVNSGISYIGDIKTEELAQLVESGRLKATTD